ncbi:MBL fold metallo-hydrolase [Candidatus Saccharibacteria bacterium]|nr:MBL fold metallo-hydrolase [Candidatus Saccharibacteria bacterium]
MFDIEYKGGNGIVVSTKKVQLVFDPKLSVVGLKDLSVKDAVEVATESRFALNDPAARLRIEGPGEYEIAEVSIKGVPAIRHLDDDTAESIDTIYRVEIGDVRMAILGNIAPKLSEEQLEAIGVVDIVVLPVGGGGYTLDATSAAVIVRQIEPHVVIPVHYADSAVSYEVPQDNMDVFIKELGAATEDAGAKYKIKAASSVPQVLTVVQIARS